MKTTFIQNITKQEKYTITILGLVLVTMYISYNVLDPLYSHMLMGNSFPLSNIRPLEWQNSLGMGLFALSGMQMIIGAVMFSSFVFGKTTTPLVPGIFFFVVSYVSIPLMIKTTSGMIRWKRIMYAYLVATQLSAPILAYWTQFGG